MRAAELIAAGVLRRLRLLPLVMGVGGVLLVLQLVAISQALMPTVAAAEAEAEAVPTEPAAAEAAQAPTAVLDDEGMLDPALLNRSEMALLTDLGKRREALDEREQALLLRERLLEATEQRIEQRITELKSLETTLNTLIGNVEGQNDEQMTNLVGVYERMKAKDAARIIERLEMDIQLAVATRMKQTKIAPILAEMNADAATKLTTKLAERKSLPNLSN